MVGVGVLQVDFLVGDVHVAADYHALALLKAAEVLPEGVFPLHAVGEAAQAVLGIGGIDVHQVETGHFEGDHAALGVVLRDADAVRHAEGLLAGVDAGAGVAFLFGVIPIGGVAEELQIQLAGLQFGLLKADEIGVKTIENIGKSLACNGPQAVYVPADEFHGCKDTVFSARGKPYFLTGRTENPK